VLCSSIKPEFYNFSRTVTIDTSCQTLLHTDERIGQVTTKVGQSLSNIT